MDLVVADYEHVLQILGVQLPLPASNSKTLVGMS